MMSCSFSSLLSPQPGPTMTPPCQRPNAGTECRARCVLLAWAGRGGKVGPVKTDDILTVVSDGRSLGLNLKLCVLKEPCSWWWSSWL